MIPRSPVPDSRFRTAAEALASALVLAAAVLSPAHALETVYTPFKDGYANTQHFNGSARILQVRSGDTKAWVQHALPNAAGADLAAARLSLFVKDVIRDGTLKVYLAAAPRGLEQQTRLDELKASGEAVGTLAIKARDAIEEQVSIPLSAAFAAAVKAGTFVGLVFEGADGLNVELGAVEDSRGALLYLSYTAGQKLTQEVYDTLVAKVIEKSGGNVSAVIGPKGEIGPAGPKGDKGDPGAFGPAGPAGSVGPAGPAGTTGAAGAAGPAGATGAVGPVGPVGPAGAKGDKGDPGTGGAASTIAEITGLQASLDSKANVSALAGKADLSGAKFTGKVGVGTANPAGMLHVDVTGSKFDVDTTLSQFTYRTSAGRSADLRLDYRGKTLGDGMLAFREDRAGVDFMLVNMLATGAGQRVVFPNGRVGIGTSAPAGLLDVRGGIAASGAGAPVILQAQAGAASNVGGNLVFNSGPNGTGSVNGSILFGTGGVLAANGTFTNGERMRLTPDGRLGFGTSDPQERVVFSSSQNDKGYHNNVVVESMGSPEYGEAGYVIRTPAGSWSWFMDDVSGDDAQVGQLGLWQNGTGNGLRAAFLTGGGLSVYGAVHATAFPTDSDRRLKTDILPIGNGLEKVRALQGVSYRWKDDVAEYLRNDKGVHLGFIAQDVEAVLPEVVATDSLGFKSMDYSRIVPVLVEAMHELEAAHAAERRAWEEKSEELEARLRALERGR